MREVGNGFDSATGNKKQFSIFSSSLNTKEQPHISFYFHSSLFKSTDDFNKGVTTNFGVSIPVNQFTSLNSALSVARELKREKDVILYVIHVQAVRKVATAHLDQQQFANDQQFLDAKQQLQDAQDDFFQLYGDSYVSRAYLGREVTIVVKFNKSNTSKTKKLSLTLGGSFPVAANLSSGISFLKSVNSSKVQSEVFMQSKGFTPSQLPPTTPEKFSQIADWLSNFEQKFTTISDLESNTVVGYDLTSYGDIFASLADDLIDDAEVKARYIFSIRRCREDLEAYIEYCNWAGATYLENTFQAKKDLLTHIERTIERQQDMDARGAADAIANLQTMIDNLNAVQLPAKLVNSFHASDFGSNVVDGRTSTDKRISTSFQLPQMPVTHVSGFSCSVRNESKKPMSGSLTFLYSMNSKVGFNAASHSIGRVANDTKYDGEIPATLQGTQINEVFLGYHYERDAESFLTRQGHKLNQCKKVEEDFTVDTYVTPKTRSPILGLHR